MKPLVSIVIPCYNQEKYIGACIESCLKQTYERIEVIVANDCSTDGSRDIIEECFEKDKIKKCLTPVENRGVSCMRNAGLEWSDGSLIAPIDGDDLLPPWSISLRVKQFLDHPELDLVHGYALKFNGDGDYDWCMDYYKEFRRSPKVKRSHVHTQTLMFRRSVIEKFGGYDEEMRSKEDKLFLCKLGLDKESPFKRPRVKAKYIDKPLAFYRRHPGSKHKLRLADKQWAAQTEKLFRKKLKEMRK